MTEPNDVLVPSTAPLRLTGRQKAAIVIGLLLEEGVAPSLDTLPEAMQADLALQFAALGSIDQATVDAVIDELGAATESLGVTFPGDVETALQTLETVISPAAAERLRRQAGLVGPRDPWLAIAEAEIEELARIIECESDAVGAVLLSKLPTAKAAEILGGLPGDLARRVAVSISRTGTVDAQAVDLIGTALADMLDAPPSGAFDGGPVARVGEILNAAPSKTRDGLLHDFAATDPNFAAEVRATIFTFADIRDRVLAEDVPAIQAALGQEDLTLLYAGADGKDAASISYLLDNMPKRLAEMVRSDAASARDPKPDELDAAMARAVAAIRRLDNEGRISLLERTDDLPVA